MVATHSAALETENNHLTVLQHEARIREWMQCKDAACRDEVRDRYADLSRKQRAELADCQGAECTKNAQKLTELAASYDARASELLEKGRLDGGLSKADSEELKAVKGMSLLILSDRNEVLLRAILSGSEEARKEAWNSIAREGALGAAAVVGVHGRAVPRLTYEAASYHGKVDTVTKSRAPANGQDALNTSVQVKQTSTRRIGICLLYTSRCV